MVATVIAPRAETTGIPRASVQPALGGAAKGMLPGWGADPAPGRAGWGSRKRDF